MSAYKYKQKLSETLRLVNDQTESAREWKKVAENRLELLSQIDRQMETHIARLLEVGTVFGVDPTDPGFESANTAVHSGEEVVMMITSKLQAVASFTANLTREAVNLQETLDDTLSIALQATRVDRPTLDMELKDYTSLFEDSSAPLRDVYEETSAEDPPSRTLMSTSVDDAGSQALVVSRPGGKSLRDLFKK